LTLLQLQFGSRGRENREGVLFLGKNKNNIVYVNKMERK
jgi:hypothetical protein